MGFDITNSTLKLIALTGFAGTYHNSVCASDTHHQH